MDGLEGEIMLSSTLLSNCGKLRSQQEKDLVCAIYRVGLHFIVHRNVAV